MNSDFAELHCLSNFSFLRGASRPEELVARAAELGYSAIALTDECSVAGVVRAHLKAREVGIKLLIGAEFALADGPRVVLLAPDRAAYGDLSEIITVARRSAKKGACRLTRDDLAAHAGRCLALWMPDEAVPSAPTLTLMIALARPALPRILVRPCTSPQRRRECHLEFLREIFPERLWIAVESLLNGEDRERLERMQALSSRFGVPLVAAGGVQMHHRSRKRLHDVLTAVRLGTTVAAAGFALAPNGERCLRSRATLARHYPPELLAETLRIAERCTFSLDELRYEYPDEIVPPGETPASYLRKLTEEGAKRRWPTGMPAKVRDLVERELKLIAELSYEPYFLTVYDAVHYARSRNIYCQGRGSAANSAVCFCLGITEVDPDRIQTLFERFISKERNEPPDIDVDFEHERREEVIQYIYAKYGRHRAALAATVITYRTRSAVRDVGKALGFSLEQVDRLAKNFQWWDEGKVQAQRLREAGFDPENPRLKQLVELVGTLRGFPRHLSQHVGGFVIARDSLSRLVPIENAAMPDRTVIQWDKDDIDALGLLKVDCLGLGMLTVLHKAFDLLEKHRGRKLTPAEVPAEDPKVYEMIGHADTVGVFQIESRAQMSMLPRLKPKCFYDLVIEIAIVRPGPIQGNMVHPYLRRRQGLEPESYPSQEVKAVLGRTLGVPIFQEQVIKLAMVAAGFSGGEADGLRRAMAAWKRRGGLEPYERRLIEGMRANGYAEKFARQIFEQIKGFGEYGFPECVVGETRIVDADTGRWVTISAMTSKASIVRRTLAFDENFRLRKRKVRAVIASGVKPVYRLRTALGHTIAASAEHPFFTIQGWRRLGELRAGDYIAATRSLPSLGRRRWPRHRIIVLADLIAEGNLCHPSTFYFYTTDRLHRDEFVRAVERFPNTRAVIKRHRSCFSVNVRRVDSTRVSGAVTWARELGLWNRGAREKRLPAEVFELKDVDISLLLARLWEGDGGFSKARHASYDTASRQLAEEVQHLLLRLGIVARLYTRIRSYRGRRLEHHVVTVTGAEALRQFWRYIGRRFLSPRKRRQSKALSVSTDARMSRDVIPVGVRRIVREARGALGLTWDEIERMSGLSIREIQSHGKRKRGFRRFVIAGLADCLHSQKLERLAESDFYWDKIVAIESLGRRETYDLTIEGNHNFLANNLFVHNSHSASFALIAYVSAWLKYYEPAIFLAAILNSQPMGFYQPSQLVQDARRHRVEVRPVDVCASDWDCTIEAIHGTEQTAVRLGLRHVKGLSRAGAERLVTARSNAPFEDVTDMVRRAALDRRDRAALAASGALKSLAGHRYRARWAVAGIEPERPLLAGTSIPEAIPLLRAPSEAEDIVADYAHVGLTLGRHPLTLLRDRLAAHRSLSAKEIGSLPHGQLARTTGIVVCRQHPSSANGVIFLTLEDETGNTNIIVWSSLVERYRRALVQASLLTVDGEVQREGEVLHLVAQRLEDCSFLLGELDTRSRDFQ